MREANATAAYAVTRALSQILADCSPVCDRLTVSAGWDDDNPFKGSHFERDVILWGVRWYVAYPISYRQIEEMMGERGAAVDHSTLHRWVLKYVVALDRCSWRASVPWAAAGAWMRPM
jgi:hypothetical protein